MMSMSATASLGSREGGGCREFMGYYLYRFRARNAAPVILETINRDRNEPRPDMELPFRVQIEKPQRINRGAAQQLHS
jgi:hypothetical protein